MVKSQIPDVPIPDDTLHQFAFKKFQEYGNKTAIVDAVSGRSYSFQDLLRRCRSFASGLVKLGAKKGDILALLSVNSIEFPVVMLGSMAAGMIVTTVNPAYTKYELALQLKDSRARFVYTMPELKQLVIEVAKQAPIKHIIVDGGGQNCVSYSKLLFDDGTAFPVSLKIDATNDVAAIPYSSGTTGVPKGVMLTHKNMLSCSIIIDGNPGFTLPAVQRYLDTNPDHQLSVLGLLPFFHIYGINIITFGSLLRGWKVVSVPKFTPELLLSSIHKHKINVLYLVPPLLVFLLKTPLLSQYDMSSVLTIGVGAAPLTREVQEQANQRLGSVDIFQGYGLTETGPIVTYPFFAKGFSTPTGSVGTLVSNTELKVIAVTTGRELGMNQEGEILMRGPQIMKGYWNRPDATRDTLDKDGWLHTGDIGYYDKYLNLYISGRIKELIKYKGFQVAPAEVEGVLLEHPGVADAGVLGIPDAVAGELPKAFVVRKVGVSLTAEDIHKHCREHLTDYKQLRGGIQFVKEIPKTASGKIIRRELKKLNIQSRL